MVYMKDQHTQIKGYRDLSQAEIDTMNECKEAAEQIGQLVEKVAQIKNIDMRWVDIGKTDLQTGFMALIRSVARPESF
jgi:hypothetical protein